jgi:hypothetical protein
MKVTYIGKQKGEQNQVDLTAGREYVVYAWATKGDAIRYYVCGDSHSYYPVPYPADLFQVTNDQRSRYWQTAETPGHPDHDSLTAYEEWISDPAYYDKLTSMKPAEQAAFAQHRIWLNAEAE